MENYLLFRAEKHNWGLHGYGDWEAIDWFIYSDRSYEVKVHYSGHEKDCDVKVIKGYLRKERFSRLLETIADDWLANITSSGCDGVTWQFMQYTPDGTVMKSSGEMGYIYGQKVLEQIALLLPAQERIDYFCVD